tara:strand:- start:138 stop:314 length:177 start_codon:yes stop_codon:yes gene_type:complete
VVVVEMENLDQQYHLLQEELVEVEQVARQELVGMELLTLEVEQDQEHHMVEQADQESS